MGQSRDSAETASKIYRRTKKMYVVSVNLTAYDVSNLETPFQRTVMHK